MPPDPPDNLDALLACAESAARAGGAHARAQAHRRGRVAARFAHDVKLVLDRECQDLAAGIIRRRFPGADILGEETAAPRGRAPRGGMRWIIDPIDGTVNFFHGLPWWCCSVAVERDGRTVAGAVYAPMLDACYTARRGRRAACNGRPLAVSAAARLRDAVILTGLDKRNALLDRELALFRDLSRRARKLRILGSAALDLCQVAAGRADAFFESGIYLWDVAAAAVIVEQAGGAAEILADYGGHRLRFLASNGRLQARLRRVCGRAEL